MERVVLRAGLGNELVGDPKAVNRDNFVVTSMGLLKVFSQEAMKTAGEYAIAHDRTDVSLAGMKNARARTLLAEVSHAIDFLAHRSATTT